MASVNPLREALTTGRFCYMVEMVASASMAEEKLGEPAVPVWNFHKILIGPDGEAIAAFGPRTPPQDPAIVEAVEKAL